MKSDTPKPTPYCCEYFKRMAKHFMWMKFVEWPEIYNMPHIQDGADSLRINFCPSCGKEVRGILIHRDDVK